MSVVATVTPNRIQFYEAEVGVKIIFDLALLSSDGCTLVPLTEAPSAGYPKLFVTGAVGSPYTLVAEVTPGQYSTTTVASQFPVNDPTEVMHFFECYIEWRDDVTIPPARILLSDAFEIAVIAAPSLNL